MELFSGARLIRAAPPLQRTENNNEYRLDGIQ